jgi:spore coat protein A
MFPWKFGALDADAAASTVAVSPILAKWAMPLRGLGGATGIPVASSVPDPVFAKTNLYEITLGEFTDVLHPGMPATKLRGYWDTKTGVARHLGGLIIAVRGTAARLRFTNALPLGQKSIIPNDPTVQTIPGQPSTEDRTATHLHGGQVPWISDGGPFDFWSPNGASGASFLNGPGSILDNIPGKPMVAGQADYFYPNDQSTRLMWYHDHAYGITRTNAYAGVATGYACIDPDQELAFGMTLPTNSKDAAGNIVPFGNLAQFIPLVFQDKKFVNAATILAQDPTWATVARPDVQTTGSLWYNHVYDPTLFKLLNLIPPPNPSCIPEFFGDTMLCNGTVQPLLTVEAKRYRFWALNACNARFLNINLLEVPVGGEVVTNKTTLLPVTPLAGPQMVQIGTEGGYLKKEVKYNNLTFFNPITMTGSMLLGCAERSDFIIDFTGMAGREFIMYNDAPGPFPAGPPTNDYFIGNNKNPAMAAVLPGQTLDTRNILKIKVTTATTADQSLPFAGIPASLPGQDPFLVPYPATIPAVGPIAPLTPPASATIRNITLNEDFDTYGRLRQLVGGTTPVPVPGKKNVLAYGLDYGAPATETPVNNGVEVWNIYNLTADTHPMHFHLVDVQVLSRQAFTLTKGVFTLTPLTQTGPELWELGWKETVKMNPGQVTTVCMKFTMPKVPFTVPYSTRGMGAGGAVIPQANEYVWHCHILEHEEHDMMRPLVVTGPNPQTPLATNPAAVSFNGFIGGGPTTVFINSNTGTTAPTVASNNAAVTATMLPAIGNNYRFDVWVAANTPGGAATVTVTDPTSGQTAALTVDIFGVTPGYASLPITGSVGGVASFGISGGTRPYTVVAGAGAAAPTLILDAAGAVIGFTVNVPAGTAAATWTYTVADASVPAKSATVTVSIV